MNNFYFGGNESGSDFDEDDTTLPFPKPLARSAFVAPDFDPTDFLSSLTNRHQTLEDLRLELRDLSQSLNKELLDLVNENYQDFLSLGSTLKGGEEKVEEVRVGLLGFQRDVGAIKGQVGERRQEVKDLLGEKKQLRKGINIGRALLEVADRMDELEARLMISPAAQLSPSKKGGDDEEPLSDLSDDSEDEDFTDDADDIPALVTLRKLTNRAQEYLFIKSLMKRIGLDHPFLVNQEGRIQSIRGTLQLDLSTMLKQAEDAGNGKDTRVIKASRLHDCISEDSDEKAAVVLRELRI